VRPLQEYLSTETAGGIVLLVAAAAALVWINAPFGDTYRDFWDHRLIIDADLLTLDLTLAQWVNDALMAVFFFVVGMEIKRELLKGELSEPRKAALPVAAALGGMIVPASIYLAFNLGGDGEHGWGIPMATDIAFAVGVLSLLGDRVPLSLKIFLLALAIVDDLGAIVVIALFYTDDLSFAWLGAGVAMFAVIYMLGRLGVKDVVVYVVVGAGAWLAVHESGVHATVAGVALGLLTPIEPYVGKRALEESASELVDEYRQGLREGTRDGAERKNAALRDLEELSRESQSVLDRLEHALHPWTSLVIIPVFALANAGVELSGGAVRDAGTSPVAAGVALGLMLGKPIGITLASLIAVQMGVAALPAGVRWVELIAVSLIAGIGFTVSLFVSALAFTDAGLIDEAKIGILAGSAAIGTVGFLTLRGLLASRTESDAAAMT
jgi:NhaA family Na+:H+ antiporter